LYLSECTLTRTYNQPFEFSLDFGFGFGYMVSWVIMSA